MKRFKLITWNINYMALQFINYWSALDYDPESIHGYLIDITNFWFYRYYQENQYIEILNEICHKKWFSPISSAGHVIFYIYNQLFDKNINIVFEIIHLSKAEYCEDNTAICLCAIKKDQYQILECLREHNYNFNIGLYQERVLTINHSYEYIDRYALEYAILESNIDMCTYILNDLQFKTESQIYLCFLFIQDEKFISDFMSSCYDVYINDQDRNTLFARVLNDLCIQCSTKFGFHFKSKKLLSYISNINVIDQLILDDIVSRSTDQILKELIDTGLELKQEYFSLVCRNNIFTFQKLDILLKNGLELSDSDKKELLCGKNVCTVASLKNCLELFKKYSIDLSNISIEHKRENEDLINSYEALGLDKNELIHYLLK